MGDGAGKKKIESFEDLFIWQKAIDFAKDIYILTEKGGLKTDFGLKSPDAKLLGFDFE